MKRHSSSQPIFINHKNLGIQNPKTQLSKFNPEKPKQSLQITPKDFLNIGVNTKILTPPKYESITTNPRKSIEKPKIVRYSDFGLTINPSHSRSSIDRKTNDQLSLTLSNPQTCFSDQPTNPFFSNIYKIENCLQFSKINSKENRIFPSSNNQKIVIKPPLIRSTIYYSNVIPYFINNSTFSLDKKIDLLQVPNDIGLLKFILKEKDKAIQICKEKIGLITEKNSYNREIEFKKLEFMKIQKFKSDHLQNNIKKLKTQNAKLEKEIKDNFNISEAQKNEFVQKTYWIKLVFEEEHRKRMENHSIKILEEYANLKKPKVAIFYQKFLSLKSQNGIS